MATPQPPVPSEVGDFSRQVHDLRVRLQELRAGDEEMQRLPAELVADLETAYEELRVADEEVSSQQEQIAKLLDRQNILHWQHERMLSMLPIPALVTDSSGMIRSVNAAAAAAASMRVARMLGRPVFTLFDASDRRSLRDLLARADSPGVVRTFATLVPRKGDLVPVEVTLTLREAGADVSWMLLARVENRPASPQLPETLSRLAALPAGHRELHDVLHQAAQLSRSVLGDDVELSIAVGPPDDPSALSATSQLAQAVDGVQWEVSAGPCVTAYATREMVTSEDLRADPRWPALTERLPVGVVSAVSAPIEVGDRLVGSLNVYGTTGEVRPEQHETVELLAATLGAVLYELELNDELDRLGGDMQRALSSRAVIEQAKGVVMAEKRCTPDEAFIHLAHLSSIQERKLRDVARTIVEQVTGDPG